MSPFHRRRNGSPKRSRDGPKVTRLSISGPCLCSCARLSLHEEGGLALWGKLLDGADLEQHFGGERAVD